MHGDCSLNQSRTLTRTTSFMCVIHYCTNAKHHQPRQVSVDFFKQTLFFITATKLRFIATKTASHLRIGFSPKGRWELNIPPLGLADVVSRGIDLGCHVQHVNSVFCHH